MIKNVGIFARAAICAAVVSIFAAIEATGEGFPRFDGVYIETKSGEFVELQPISASRLNVCEGERRLDSVMVPDQSEVVRSPQIRRGTIESIFIRSRTERLQFVSSALELNVFLEPLRGRADVALTQDHPVLGPCERSSIFPREFRRINQADSSIVDVTCGWRDDRFRVLNESETTFQYFERGNRIARARSQTAGQCGNSNNERHSEGIFIQTNQNRYFVRYGDSGNRCIHRLTGNVEYFTGDCPNNWIPSVRQ